MLSLTRSRSDPVVIDKEFDAASGLGDPWQLRRTPPQDTPNTAVFGDFISAVQPLIGTPMHTRWLFRKGIKNVWFGSQSG